MGKGFFIRIFGVFSICALFASSTVVADDVPDCGTDGWYYLSIANVCKKCDYHFDHSDNNAEDETQCYRKIGEKKQYLDDRDRRDCPKGTYLPKNATQCKDCPEGSWCPGWSGWYYFDNNQNRGLNSCPSDYKHSASKSTTFTNCYKKFLGIKTYFECGSGHYFEGSTCKTCPSGYSKTYSNQINTRPEDCFKENGQDRYNEINCPMGKYLPKGKKEPAKCLDKSDGYYCPGGAHLLFSDKYDQGIGRCAPGYIPKSDNGGCYKAPEEGGNNDNTVTCDPGQYLQKGSDTCKQCKTGYYCPGGTYTKYPAEDIGLFLCDNGYYPNDNQTDCEQRDIHGCKSGPDYYGEGQWWNGDKCKSCPNKFKNSEKNTVYQYECFEFNSKGKKIYYKQHGCGEGLYLPKESDECAGCPDDGKSYCPGIYTTVDPDFNNDQGIFACPDNEVPNLNKTGCEPPSENGCKSGQYKPSGGNCENCPFGFTKSKPGATNENDCYAEIGNSILYYEKKHCDVGKYMPKKTNQCDKQCEGDNKCSGGDYYTSTLYNRGITPCGENETHSADYKTCIPKNPDNPTVPPAPDPEQDCGGSGTYTLQNGSCYRCPDGFTKSIDNASRPEDCYETVNGQPFYYAEVSCKPGEYLSKNKGRPSQCTNNAKYCPGGTFYTSTKHSQGAHDCPKNAVANSNHSACVFNLSQTFMKHGPSGTAEKFSEQCWTRKDIRSYAQCLFSE